MARQIREVIEARDHAGEDTPRARTAAIAQRWMEFLDKNPEMFLLLVEYWAFAVRRGGETHVKIGHGRHYSDVAPINCVYRGDSGARLDARVHMTRQDPAASARA